ncbi:uncharacterized protein PAE49_017086 [Odontesthes bonariensis]
MAHYSTVHPHTEQERRFNTAHSRTRATVESCIWLLKLDLSLGCGGNPIRPKRYAILLLHAGISITLPKKMECHFQMYIQRTPYPEIPTTSLHSQERSGERDVFSDSDFWTSVVNTAGRCDAADRGQRQRQRLRMLTGPRIRRAGQVARMPLRIHL